MTTRRGFLGAMLAAGVAPFVMSSGIASGVLMPVRKLWAPAGVLSLFTKEGLLLARVVYPELDASPCAPVEHTGIFDHATFLHPALSSDVTVDLRLSSDYLSAGSTLNMMPLQLVSS